MFHEIADLLKLPILGSTNSLEESLPKNKNLPELQKKFIKSTKHKRNLETDDNYFAEVPISALSKERIEKVKPRITMRMASDQEVLEKLPMLSASSSASLSSNQSMTASTVSAPSGLQPVTPMSTTSSNAQTKFRMNMFSPMSASDVEKKSIFEIARDVAASGRKSRADLWKTAQNEAINEQDFFLPETEEQLMQKNLPRPISFKDSESSQMSLTLQPPTPTGIKYSSSSKRMETILLSPKTDTQSSASWTNAVQSPGLPTVKKDAKKDTKLRSLDATSTMRGKFKKYLVKAIEETRFRLQEEITSYISYYNRRYKKSISEDAFKYTIKELYSFTLGEENQETKELEQVLTQSLEMGDLPSFVSEIQYTDTSSNDKAYLERLEATSKTLYKTHTIQILAEKLKKLENALKTVLRGGHNEI